MIPQTISLGPISLHFYGIFVALALISGVLLARHRAKKYKIAQEKVEEAVIFLALPVLVGARLYHVLDFWDYYGKNPAKIIAFWEGGIGIYGALILGVGALYSYTKLKKLSFFSFADLFAPSVALAQAIGRIGNFFNQEGFGPPTNLPWKVLVPEGKRPEIFLDKHFFHPTFFYEAILNFAIFLTLIFLARRKNNPPGFIFGSYVILYSTGRFFLEFLRLDTWVIDEFKVAQVISLLGLIFATAFLLRLKRVV